MLNYLINKKKKFFIIIKKNKLFYKIKNELPKKLF